jgi:hypothetical protein
LYRTCSSPRNPWRDRINEWLPAGCGQIEAVLQPRQVAALKAIARKEKASWTLLQQDRAALDDLHATAEQRAKWRQMSDEDLPVPNMPLLAAAGEKAVAVLTPEQLEKLDKAIEHYGW